MAATMRDSLKLFITPNMLLFSITMFFTGLNQTLWVGVYSGCIGFTKGFVCKLSKIKSSRSR